MTDRGYKTEFWDDRLRDSLAGWLNHQNVHSSSLDISQERELMERWAATIATASTACSQTRAVTYLH
jgi:hypothetical protein